MRTSDFDPISVEVFNKQLKKATFLVLLVFGALILRLWFLQIVTGSLYRAKSQNNRIRLLELSPNRGMIFDRNGDMLVGNRPSYDLFVIQEEVSDKAGLLGGLHRLIGLGQEQAVLKMNKMSLGYPFRPICLKRDMSRDELAIIETHRFNLPGVMIKVKPQRHYVYGKLACHLLGYLGEISEKQLRGGRYPGNRPGDLIGKAGVERKWETSLDGIEGGEQVEVDASGRKIRAISLRPPISGAEVFLTIDRRLQNLAEGTLKGKKGAIVAIDPRDGEVLALASSPGFDPNLFVEGIDKATWKKISSSKDFSLQDRALAGQYPPGSVFKIVVALAGLEDGIIDPDEEIVCNGFCSLGDRIYRCWTRHGPGVNLHRALVESCDVYFYEMGRRLGVDKIARYAKRFGLGKRTGIDVGLESPGLIPTRDWKLDKIGMRWQAGETLSMSIGQSYVLVTPIQMCSLIAAVFNGGVLYRPQVTKWVGRSDTNIIHKFIPKVAGTLGIKKEYLELVKNALTGVVNEAKGTGWRARLRHIKVAGKTGTAQVVTLKKREELEGRKEIPREFRDHAWFVGTAPAKRPRIALAIVLEHGGLGGRDAAPIARKIFEAYLGDTWPG